MLSVLSNLSLSPAIIAWLVGDMNTLSLDAPRFGTPCQGKQSWLLLIIFLIANKDGCCGFFGLFGRVLKVVLPDVSPVSVAGIFRGQQP